MRLQSLLTAVYGWLLQLYPRSFQDEYGIEMIDVFADAVSNSAEINTFSLLRIFVRELRDLPRALWREHTTARRKEVLAMGTIHSQPLLLLGSVDDPGTRRDAWLAAIPALLVVLVEAIPSIFYAFEIVPWPQNGTSPLGLIITVSVAALLLFILIYAWRNGWPRWSAGWYLYWGVALAVPFFYVLSVWQPTQTLNNSTVGFFVVLPWLIVVWLFKIMRDDPFKGMLLALPVVTVFWSPVREFVDPKVREPINLLIWLLTAGAAYVIVRRGNLRLSLLVTVGVSLINGLLISYAQVYRNSSTMAYRNPPPSFGQVVEWFAPTMIGTAALVLGMLLVWLIWQFGRNLGRHGRWGAALILVALFINLGSFLTSWWVAAELDYVRIWFFDIDTSTAVLGNLFNLSLLLYLVGIGLLIVGMRTRFSAEKTVVLSALLLVPIALPFFFAYPFIFLMNWAQLEFPAILARLTALSANWLFTLGAIWLIVTIVLLTVSRHWLSSLRAAP
ncbi:MAG: hypothetical protein M9928_22340 [Anaerolineae bacterium]|nr:hypothetical protein [Anaerolineae bacterium]